MMYTTHKRHLLVVDENCFVVITIIHHSTVGVFILLKIWYLLIYSYTLTSNDSLAKGNRTYSIRTLSKLSFLITVQRVRQYISGILRIAFSKQLPFYKKYTFSPEQFTKICYTIETRM